MSYDQECQYHNICGGWCETEVEREAGLCQDCLDSEAEAEKREAEMLAEIALLKKQRDELLAALDTTVKAIIIFRNEPMLERLHGLRSSDGYGVLQQAMDIGRDAIASAKGAE